MKLAESLSVRLTAASITCSPALTAFSSNVTEPVKSDRSGGLTANSAVLPNSCWKMPEPEPSLVLVRAPGDHEDCRCSQVRQRRFGLVVISGVAVDQPVAIHRVAAGVEFTQIHVAPRGAAVVVEGDHEAASGQAADPGLVLAAVGVFVDLDLTAHCRAAGVVALGVGGVAGAVPAVVVAPDDDVAAVRRGPLRRG